MMAFDGGHLIWVVCSVLWSEFLAGCLSQCQLLSLHSIFRNGGWWLFKTHLIKNPMTVEERDYGNTKVYLSAFLNHVRIMKMIEGEVFKEANCEIKDTMPGYLKTMEKVNFLTHLVPKYWNRLSCPDSVLGATPNTDRGVLSIFKIFKNCTSNIEDKFECRKITHNPIALRPIFAH